MSTLLEFHVNKKKIKNTSKRLGYFPLVVRLRDERERMATKNRPYKETFEHLDSTCCHHVYLDPTETVVES